MWLKGHQRKRIICDLNRPYNLYCRIACAICKIIGKRVFARGIGINSALPFEVGFKHVAVGIGHHGTRIRKGFSCFVLESVFSIQCNEGKARIRNHHNGTGSHTNIAYRIN